MDIKFKSGWMEFFTQEMEKPYFKNLINTVEKLYEQQRCFPPKQYIFKIFSLINPKDIKVVILGQDPYHGYNQANGIAFSVNEKVRLPASLQNIFKELYNDLGIDHFSSGNLFGWLRQGVFLYNTVLTVTGSQPNSHRDIGWLIFTNNLMQYLNNFREIIYVLWGMQAKKYESLIKNRYNIISSAHPSPFSFKMFQNSKPFSRINDMLCSMNKIAIDWNA